jgi:hypothetical protein
LHVCVAIANREALRYCGVCRKGASMNFLEELLIRHQESQKKMAEAQKIMQEAQARYQTVAQEHSSLLHLINLERTSLAKANEGQQEIFPKEQKQDLPTLPVSNQSDIVRNLIRQNPAGITPKEMWKTLQTQIKYRAYFYSILKRLRDRDEVIFRRGKYLLKITPKSEVAKEEGAAIH